MVNSGASSALSDEEFPKALQALAFIFNSTEEFEAWVLRLNSQDGIQYRRVCTQAREKSGCEYIMFHCHKSGKVRIKEDDSRKRKHREGKSKKLGFMCTSKVVCRKHYKETHVNWRKLDGRKDIDGYPLENERVPVSEGQVSVVFHHTHAHDITEASIRETPISEHTRRIVKVWRALGMSVDEIYEHLNAARVDENTSLGLSAIASVRERNISKRDLRNILVSCNMYRRDQPRSEEITDSDVKSGDLLVNELQMTYGTGEGPIPPPIWGNAHPVEDSQAAHHMIKVYKHLKEAAASLESLGTSLDKVDPFLVFRHRINTMCTSMLMSTCKKLLYPTTPIHHEGIMHDDGLHLASTNFMLSQSMPGIMGPKSNTIKMMEHDDEQNFVV